MTNRPPRLSRPAPWRQAAARRGASLVLVVVCLIPLVSFVALAIDLGMLATARTQLMQATDAAAMAGTRALNGDTTEGNNNNYAGAAPAAIAAATSNQVLGGSIPASAVNVQIGRYVYNASAQRFEGQFPGPSTENWSLVRVTLNQDLASQMAFARIFNFAPANIQASATAAHRPRDVAVILDYSGSMRFGSLLGTPYSGDRATNNRDTNVPTWGAYSSSSANLVAGSPSAPYDEANLSATTADGRAEICRDFYQTATGTRAFLPASSSLATTPGGDVPLKTSKNTSSTYGQTLWSILNSSGSPTSSSRDATFETQGYAAYGMSASFSRYTQGPNYWGKTFFIWPPDPANGADGQTNDWRKRYFDYPGTSTPMDDNSRLWNSSGNWRAPGSSSYQIDYAAILNFIKNIGPNPFPGRLQAGRILYYDQIPDSINTSSWPPSDLNQRFWKDYIDYVLGVMQTGGSSWTVHTNGSNGKTGYGADYTWGTVQITANSSLSGSPKPYMHYGDNPRRPRLHFWFGPLSMVDFLGNYNLWYDVDPACSRFCWWPGTCREAPMYACKLGVRAALTDIQNNHPNDLVSMIMFSVPRTSTSDAGNRFNRVRVSLGRDYARMQESLWYPAATLGDATATVRPYDSENLDVPRAMGGTCYAYPLMLAYNQFSANTSLLGYNSGAPAGDAGGNGRKGAQKVIIFETDGAPNTTASATLTDAGSNNSYYRIRYNNANPSGSEFPTSVNGYANNSSTVTTQINAICSQLCAADTASPPGYWHGSKKVLIHCIGFGPAFDPSNSEAPEAIATLNQMQLIGNVNDGMPSYKIVYGHEDVVVEKLQQAFTKIMRDGVQVSLIE
jgi:Flp pilus assembly protein TadG